MVLLMGSERGACPHAVPPKRQIQPTPTNTMKKLLSVIAGVFALAAAPVALAEKSADAPAATATTSYVVEMTGVT